MLASFGAAAGASAAFLAGRYLARRRISRRFGHNETFRLIDEAVAAEGWKIVFLTRLSPVFPFNVQNYLYSFSGVFFGDTSFENGSTITVGGKKLRLKKAIIADAIRRAAGEWNKRRLTPFVAGLLARWLKFQRLDAMPLDAGTFS